MSPGSLAFSIGNYVRVVASTDETLDTRYLGHFGVIVDKKDGTQGKVYTGESSNDPFWVVKTLYGTDCFWSEELQFVTVPQGGQSC
jgi:hypothetical protein